MRSFWGGNFPEWEIVFLFTKNNFKRTLTELTIRGKLASIFLMYVYPAGLTTPTDLVAKLLTL